MNSPIKDTPKYDNLTRYEHDALGRNFNLADGHAHQNQNTEQHHIIAQLPSIFYRAEASSQRIIERDFQASLFSLAGQASAVNLHSCMFCYSGEEGNTHTRCKLSF